MKKIFLSLFILISFTASAQWTIINGNQRFVKGLGIPVRDTIITGVLASDSAQIVLRPQDSTVYVRYKGRFRKVGVGGAGTQNLQSVLNNGNSADTDIILSHSGFQAVLSGTSGVLQLISNDNSTVYINSTGTEYVSADANSYLYLYPNFDGSAHNLWYPNQYKSDDTLATLEDVRAGASTIDTTSLSNRINLRVKYTDTASMLSPYLRKTDTTGAFLSLVSQPNDSTLTFKKGGISSDYVIRSASSASSATKLSTTAYNQTGATITKGSVVYINGSHGNQPTITLAKANAEATSAYTYGIAAADIPNNSSGSVVQAGLVENLNTNSFNDGDAVYLSPTTAGGYTTTKPLSPSHYVFLGIIVRKHFTQGTLQLYIHNGFQLDEMSDVSIALVPNDSTILQFSRVDSLWHDVDPTTAMGNRFIKRTDTASMLSPYARTSSLSSYLQKSDSTTYQTKYRSDTARINTYSGISSKLNTSDSSTIYQTKYREDTSRINIYNSISSKQNTITLTTTGTTGVATFSSNTINIPNYSNNDDYFTQACQLLGSTIKGFNLGVPRGSAMLTQTAVLTNQNVRFFAYYLPNAQTITGVKWFQNTIGSYTANNYNGVGLYTYSGGTMTLVASSTNDGNIWQTATSGTMGSKAFSSTYSASAGIYYIGILYCASAATTAPALAAPPGNVTATSTNFDFTNSAKFFGQVGGTALPSTQACSGLATNTASVGIWLY